MTPSPYEHDRAGMVPTPVAWRYLVPTGWKATTDPGEAVRLQKHCVVEPLYPPRPSDVNELGESCGHCGGSLSTATLIASTCTSGTTAPIAMPMVAAENCSLAPATNLSCDSPTDQQSSSGAASRTTASTSAPESDNKASIAPSSATRASTYRVPSFSKRMQSLMRSGLIAGITPTSIAKRWPQRTLDIAFSPLAGSDVVSPKADCSCSNESAADREPA